VKVPVGEVLGGVPPVGGHGLTEVTDPVIGELGARAAASLEVLNA
jgi:hypothetical protein